MKTTKKIAVLLIVALLIAAMPVSAFAKKKKKSGGKAYVPTAGEYYTFDESKNDWDKNGTFTASYKKDGRITAFTEYNLDGTVYRSFQYSWKKNNLKKVVTTEYYPSSKRINTTTYKYKKKLPKTETGTSEYVNSADPSQNNTSSYTVKYTWSKKTGSGRKTYSDSSNREVEAFDLTKKKQLKGTFTNHDKITYYKNGNIKKIVKDVVGKDYRETTTTTYNKNGYEVSYDQYEYYKGTHGEEIYTSHYDYQYVGGKNFSEIICSAKSEYKDTGDPEENFSSSNKYKIKVTGSKKVKRSRNCDRFGHLIMLGYND